MRRFFSDLVSRLAEDYGDASSAKKVVLICSLSGVFIALAVLGIRSCSSTTPVRELRAARVGNLSKTDDKGDEWVLQALPGQMLRKFGEGAVLGEPLKAKTDVEIKEGVVSIGVVVEGRAGEKYVAGAMKNGAWQPAPKYKIVDERGRQLAADSFKYG